YYGNPPTMNVESAAQKRAWFLLPLARTLPEREPLLQQLYNPKEEKITAEMFDKVFTDVQAKGDPGDKRQAIADLLFGLLEPRGGDCSEAQPYRRSGVCGGRKAAVTTVDNQAATLTQLTRETEDTLAGGRSKFAAEHGRGVARLRELAEVVQRENDALEYQKAQTARQEE